VPHRVYSCGGLDDLHFEIATASRGRSAMTEWTVVSSSQSQTRNWGKRLAKLLHSGEIIGLTGELGAGKTCFVRGLAEGLSVGDDAWVRSPTFTLINEYHGRLPVYHIDLFRVSGRAEQETLDLREYLYGEGVCLVEWFEYLSAAHVDEYLEVNLAHAGANRRRLTFTAHGPRYDRMLTFLRDRSKVHRFDSSNHG
jgi:tRNA threonylcarbamoyladenosine biosynthesis protein TsaE